MNQEQNNFNTQGNNVVTNNQNLNRKAPLGLIIGIIAAVVIIGIGAFIIFGNNSNTNDNLNDDSGDSKNVDITYYDSKRTLKNTYTFKEAVSKFAFKVNKTTLIFEENDKIKLEMISSHNNIYNELMDAEFYYKQGIYTSLEAMYLGESNSSTLEDFKTNFNNGILSDNKKLNVVNVEIIEDTDDYVFAFLTHKAITTTNEYYFAKKIGNRVYYASNTTMISYSGTEVSLLLDGFKNLFTCLSEDDGKEPYIYDKVVNVPIVLNKKIKDINNISAIINVNKNDYFDGKVSLANEKGDYVSLGYGASKRYDDIDWTKTFDSNIKYTYEDDKNIIGINDNKNTQIFEINTYSADKQITNTKEFNSYVSKYLIEK